jgi:hypothetical protein
MDGAGKLAFGYEVDVSGSLNQPTDVQQLNVGGTTGAWIGVTSPPPFAQTQSGTPLSVDPIIVFSPDGVLQLHWPAPTQSPPTSTQTTQAVWIETNLTLAQLTNYSVTDNLSATVLLQTYAPTLSVGAITPEPGAVTGLVGMAAITGIGLIWNRRRRSAA